MTPDERDTVRRHLGQLQTDVSEWAQEVDGRISGLIEAIDREEPTARGQPAASRAAGRQPPGHSAASRSAA